MNMVKLTDKEYGTVYINKNHIMIIGDSKYGTKVIFVGGQYIFAEESSEMILTKIGEH